MCVCVCVQNTKFVSRGLYEKKKKIKKTNDYLLGTG